MLSSTRNIVAISLFAFCFAGVSRAASEEWIISDWHTHGIQDQWRAKYLKDLRSAVAQQIPGAVTVAKAYSDPFKALTLNLQHHFEHWLTNSPGTATAAAKLIVPTWCAIGDQDVWVMQKIQLKSGLVDQVAITSTPRALLRENRSTAVTALTAAISNGLEQIKTPATRPPTALQLAINLGVDNTRYDQATGRCLALVATAQILTLKNLAVLNTIEREDFATFRSHLMRDAGRVSRSHRSLTLMVQPDAATKNKLPLPAQWAWQLSEGVLGQSTEQDQRGLANLSIAKQNTQNPAIEFKLPDALVSALQQAAQDLEGTPQISKVYRAWVYLDRGRAYGLKLDDRLVNSDGSIAGHVVGYFGPKLKILSPRGRVINEGAIVYLRKGQRLAQIGQSLEYDQTTYPTAWPPP